MELVIVFAVLIVFFGGLEIRNYIIELQRENQFLRERWLYDIKRDVEIAKKEMARLDRYTK